MNSTYKTFQIGDDANQGCLAIHVYSRSISIVDMTNAGKRGKVCPTISICGDDNDVSNVCNFCHNGSMKLGDVDNFTQAILFAQACKDEFQADVYNNTKRGVDVIPANLKPFTFRNNKVAFECTINDYDCSDLLDGANEPKLIAGSSEGVRAKKAFYNFCVKNAGLFTDNTSMHDIHEMANKCGCRPHSYCAMD
jgi:hypothetical protein